MPLFNFLTKQPLSQITRSQIAKRVTEIYCGITGAPKEYVSTIFIDGARPMSGIIDLAITLRAGREAAELDNLGKALAEMISLEAEVARSSVSIQYHRLPAKWVMEGGKVLPEPGSQI